MKAIHVKEPGGPEAMQLVDVPTPAPGPRQALVRIAASGVNFIDVYFRTGLYKADSPITIGSEAAGTVEAVGSEVTLVAPGDRVAYAMVRGSYAEYAVVAEEQLVKLPETVDFESAAAAMLQGMTAHYLTHSTFPLAAGQTCLVHAAAGGAGRLIAQMAKARGARVLGTVSSPEKAGDCRCGRRRPRHQLHRDVVRYRGQADHRRRRRRRRLRLGRQDDVRARAWRVCGPAACWCCSASRAARCHLSIRRC